MSYRHIRLPEQGTKIRVEDGRLVVPDQPILGFIHIFSGRAHLGFVFGDDRGAAVGQIQPGAMIFGIFQRIPRCLRRDLGLILGRVIQPRQRLPLCDLVARAHEDLRQAPVHGHKNVGDVQID